eukprot:COSAG01_NODE_2951_length_6804_cov_32.584489_4_plen_96_part_00
MTRNRYGLFVRATVRHRIEGPRGKWDPQATPASEWPAEGSRNTSWALVTMANKRAADCVFENEPILAGATKLKVTRFSKRQVRNGCHWRAVLAIP